MKKFLLIPIGIILSLFVSVNAASALSPSIAESIKDLPFGDQLSLLAQRVDENSNQLVEHEEKISQQKADIETLQEELESEKAKNEALNNEIDSQTQKKSQEDIDKTKKEACEKEKTLAKLLPSGMPAKYDGFPPDGTTIKNYLDYYKSVSGDTNKWYKDDKSTVTKEDVGAAVTYLEGKYNEYISAKQVCSEGS